MAGGEPSAKAKPSSSSSFNQSAKGDWRAAKLLLDTLHESEGRAEPEISESSFGAADQKVIAQLKTRLRGNKGGSDD
jgi:hypothetical protein